MNECLARLTSRHFYLRVLEKYRYPGVKSRKTSVLVSFASERSSVPVRIIHPPRVYALPLEFYSWETIAVRSLNLIFGRAANRDSLNTALSSPLNSYKSETKGENPPLIKRKPVLDWFTSLHRSIPTAITRNLIACIINNSKILGLRVIYRQPGGWVSTKIYKSRIAREVARYRF